MQRDGEPQQSDRWPGWLVSGCPLHDHNYEQPPLDAGDLP